MKTAPKPTEVHDHIDTIALVAGGFTVMPDDQAAGWICVPWGQLTNTGYGTTGCLAIADAAHQLEHQATLR